MPFDDDLNPVLERATNDELEILVKLLTKPMSEELTSTEKYKRYHPNHRKYVYEIADEIRLYGGNTFVNKVVRGGNGPKYAEIVTDVAKEIGAKYGLFASVPEIEEAILLRIGSLGWEAMTPEQRQEWAKELGIDGLGVLKEFPLESVTKILSAGGVGAFQCSMGLAAPLLVNVLGAGVLAALAVSFLMGPVGIALASAWAVVKFAGPATDVTKPCVVYVAALRRKP